MPLTLVVFTLAELTGLGWKLPGVRGACLTA